MYKAIKAQDYKRMLGLPDGYKVDGFLSCGNWDVTKKSTTLEKRLVNSGVNYKIKRLSGYLQNTFEIKIGDSTYWFSVVYGGATLGEYLHFACLFGSKKNIHVGSCGGLYPKMQSMDYLIPTWSYGNESSTRFYDRENEKNIHYPDKKLSNNLKTKLAGEKVWEGPVITCQAMLAETREDVERWSRKRYYGVEMETSTVFAVSRHFKIPSAALVYISDNLIKGQTVGDESHNQQKEIRGQKAQKMFGAAIGVLLS